MSDSTLSRGFETRFRDLPGHGFQRIVAPFQIRVRQSGIVESLPHDRSEQLVMEAGGDGGIGRR